VTAQAGVQPERRGSVATGHHLPILMAQPSPAAYNRYVDKVIRHAMTQLLTPTAPRPSATTAEQPRVLLQGISWDTYMSLLKDIGDGAPRLTFDNGDLEIEVPGRLHELIKSLVAEMITSAMKRMSISYEPAGATTWKQHAILKGLEADECYHIQSIQKVLGKSELDLTIDPPPDLAIEVEVTSPSLIKMEVYRGLKVPELWRVRADAICSMYRLDEAGAYQPISASIAVPIFTPALISQYVLLREQLNHSETIRRFESEVLAKIGR
jgi:Uma2 family endonuclease